MSRPREIRSGPKEAHAAAAVVATEAVRSREEQRIGPMYAGRVQVYPKAVSGPVRKAKWAVLAACLTAY